MKDKKEFQYLDNNFYLDIKNLILDARKRIYTNIKYEMVFAYWQIGKMIVDKQGGEDRAEYGSGLIKELSQQMTPDFGKGFDERNLELMRQFYRSFPNPNTVCTQLSWSHLRLLMRVNVEKQEISI